MVAEVHRKILHMSNKSTLVRRHVLCRGTIKVSCRSTILTSRKSAMSPPVCFSVSSAGTVSEERLKVELLTQEFLLSN